MFMLPWSFSEEAALQKYMPQPPPMVGRNSPTSLSATREAHSERERAKAKLKSLTPEDAQQAIGHGIRAKTFEVGLNQL
jgi:hypothetical protein